MEQHNLNNAINMLQEKGVPFAVYQQPDNNEVCLVAQVEPVHLVHDIKEICYSSGFLVFPFESVITGVGYFITSDLFACANNGLGDFIKKIEALPNKISEDAVTETYELSKQEYLTIAQDLIRRLRNKDLQKVVLSRLKVVKPDNKLDLASLFLRLLKQYSNTFVYLFSIPDVGTWFGATPEILLSQKANGDVVIMSLAGTTSYVNNGKVDWGNKEVVEQRYVSEFIRERW
jgi:isochorismate synthase